MAGSAADQLRALVEAAELEAKHSRESVERLAERADELSRGVDAVAEALAALKEEIEALRSAGEAPPAEDPGTRIDPGADDELIAEAEAAAARKPEPEAQPAVPEGARLLALKMALDGRPREETAAYLSENFELDDPGGLLDEVYAHAEARK